MRAFWGENCYRRNVELCFVKKIEKSKDIAKRQNISGCLVTKRMKKMIEYIQSDKELCDILRELL